VYITQAVYEEISVKMPIIKNNLYYEMTTETQTKPVSAVKIQLDVLDGCSHSCSGCYVNRRNNGPTKAHLKDLKLEISKITDQGVLVDEILVGPTDFLSSENLYDVIGDKNFLDMINTNSPILAFVTTLMTEDNSEIDKFCKFVTDNINTDTEIEIGIATQPSDIMDINYISKIQSQLKIISDSLNHDITYTFILNIDNYEIDYENLNKHIVNTFDTTIDLVPSIARSKNKSKIIKKIRYLNDFYNNLSTENAANNIMVDHSHSGMNFKVLNFKKGEWYISPFLYENMAIYDDRFKVDNFTQVHDKFTKQYKTNTECRECNFLSSCASRGIILLMDFLGERECIAPKENLEKNKNIFNHAANKMYDWDGYSTDRDKEGYRKKFLVHSDGDERLAKIKEIYNGNA
jgi:hypothetical protein